METPNYWRNIILKYKEISVIVGGRKVCWQWQQHWVDGEPRLTFQCYQAYLGLPADHQWREINGPFHSSFTMDSKPMDIMIVSIVILEILELDPQTRLRILAKLCRNMGDPDACTDVGKVNDLVKAGIVPRSLGLQRGEEV